MTTENQFPDNNSDATTKAMHHPLEMQQAVYQTVINSEPEINAIAIQNATEAMHHTPKMQQAAYQL